MAGIVVVLSAGPLADPDVWWHIRLGRQIITTRRLPHVETWSFAILGHVWRPTAWLSDVGYGATFDAFGFRGIIALKVAVCAVVLWRLYRMLSATGRSPVAVALTFALVAFPLSVFLRERPQAISLLFVIWLAPQCARIRHGGQLAAWPFLGLEWLWANIHGMWVLGPLAVALAAAGNVADSGRDGLRRAGRHLVLGCAAIALAACTPVGPGLVIQPFHVVSAAKYVNEWLPTTLWQGPLVVYVLVICILLVAAARRDRRMPWADALWIGGVFVFSLMAERNTGPALLLLAVPTVEALADLVTLESRVTVPRLIPITVLGVAVAVSVTQLAVEPPVSRGIPVRLVHELGALPGPRHVLDDYNIGGFITGNQPRASVAIDGRTDNYPAGYVADYLDALGLKGDWSGLIRRLNPDCALLPDTSPLAHVLTAEYGWRTVDRQVGYLLLERGPTGRTTPTS